MGARTIRNSTVATTQASTAHDRLVDIGPALGCSRVGALCGRPYPVQFRNQGAIDAWTNALHDTAAWAGWGDPRSTAADIRRQLLWYMDQMQPLARLPAQEVAELALERQTLAVEISANLKYHLNHGTVIEATPALETLLAHSDVDLSLPMSMVAPPYPAQYLRFGPEAAQHLTVPRSPTADQRFDGVFCFFTPPSSLCVNGPTYWTLELIFIAKRQDRFAGILSLSGETERGAGTVGEWLGVLLGAAGEAAGDLCPMYNAVSYAVRVFLYMALKQARVIERREHAGAARQLAGLGPRKRAKLQQRMASFYDGILVGPDSISSAPTGGAGKNGVAPHWRRGHFRMQAFGPGMQERRLIFVAPVLIHADQLQGDAPTPKPYRAVA